MKRLSSFLLFGVVLASCLLVPPGVVSENEADHETGPAEDHRREGASDHGAHGYALSVYSR